MNIGFITRRTWRVVFAVFGILLFIGMASMIRCTETHRHYPVQQVASKHMALQSWTTQQGLRVVFVARHELPMLDLQLRFDAGSVRDPQDKSGLATLTNQLLDQGTNQHDVDAFAGALADLGAEYEHGTTLDMAYVSLRVLTRRPVLNPAIALLAEALRAPAFRADALERKRAQQLLSIRYKAQNPSILAHERAYAAVFQQGPYGRSRAGRASDVKHVSVADVRTFYQQHYGAQGAVLAIVGDISTEQAQQFSKEMSEALAAYQAPRQKPQPSYLDRAQKISVPYPAKQKTLVIAAPGIARTASDYYPLLVGNTILGGGSGLVSRLAKTVRETSGLAYGVSSHFQSFRTAGLFVLTLKTRQTEADKAQALSLRVLSKFIEQGPSDKEVEQAKQYLIGHYPLSVASNRQVVSIIAQLMFDELNLNDVDPTPAIQAVTREQIQAAFVRHMAKAPLVQVAVG